MRIFWFMVLILFSFTKLEAQTLPADVCKVRGGMLEFKLDLRWGATQKQALIDIYDLDSLLIAKIYQGKKSIEIGTEKWQVKTIDKTHVLLSKQVEEQSFFSNFFKFMFEDNQKSNPRPGYVSGPVYFGYNQFKRQHITMDNDKVEFFLPGFLSAKEVILSGSFNDWSTSQLKMKKGDDGWRITLKLKPYKYYYKFIIDGHWVSDPWNLQHESDGYGDENSILFVTNHVFNLKGYKKAKKVILTGSFNEWNEEDVRLIATESGWQLPVYLDFGRHKYKYIVDGEWILDPGNPEIAGNEYGTGNSVVNIGEGYTFTLNRFLDAKEVYLSGSFNAWQERDLRMKKTSKGWQVTCYFGPGNYEYKFIVDGHWITDPKNPYTNGTGDFVNSFFVFKPNHTFVLEGFSDSKKVIVTGSFNGWIHHGYEMRKANGRWELPVYLPKGKILYRIIVDGVWMRDPGNINFENNEFDGYNSVLWVE